VEDFTRLLERHGCGDVVDEDEGGNPADNIWSSGVEGDMNCFYVACLIIYTFLLDADYSGNNNFAVQFFRQKLQTLWHNVSGKNYRLI